MKKSPRCDLRFACKGNQDRLSEVRTDSTSFVYVCWYCQEALVRWAGRQKRAGQLPKPEPEDMTEPD
jgi:hypothetical protein